MVVLHYTGMETFEAAVDRLCDPSAEVSAHYLIDDEGAVLPLVDEPMRAWHAGAGAWGDVEDVNSRSIGIELANKGPDSDAPAFPPAQMSALEELLGGIMSRWAIPAERVIGHSDMAPGRKVDPGPYFDWPRLAGRGLAIWCDPQIAEVNVDVFRQSALAFGYRPPNGDWEKVLAAFRLRFRPGAEGPLDGVDTGTMAALAAQWPCATT